MSDELRPVRRVALITATEPEPRRYGKSVVIGGMLDHLQARLGPCEVHLVLIGRAGAQRPPAAYRVHVLDKPGALRQLSAVAQHVVLPALRGRPVAGCTLQEAALRSPALARQLRHLLDDIDPDLEIWDTLRVAQYAPDVTRRRRVLYADDLFSERYASLLRGEVSANANIGGEFLKLLPAPARRLLSDPRVYRPLLRLEQRLVAAAEVRDPHRFDATYLINQAETERLRARCPGPLIDTLPPLLPEPRRLPRAPDYERPLFTFVGGFAYAPNVDGVEWFLRCCRDALLARVPNASIAVVGSGSERGLADAQSWGDRVRFLGFVEDLDALLARSVALISPLRSGSGVKIKVLEALARAVPVIATPAGVYGINEPERNGCLVSDTPESFASSMHAACDPDTNAALSTAARAAWDEHYAPAVVRRRYDALFNLTAQAATLSPTPVPAAATVTQVR